MGREVQAHMCSLNGGLRTVKIVFEQGSNSVIVKYDNNYYSAIFNPFTWSYYVDDVYGKIPEKVVRERLGR